MRYYMKKSTNKTTKSYGKYIARVSHDQIVGVDEFAASIEESCSLAASDVVAALKAFGHEISRHLRQGDIVKLPDLGTFKLEMECTPVDDPKDFVPSKHLNRFQLHVLPESKDGHRPLYEGIDLTKVKDY